jgi:hypothetical protein
MPSHIDMTTHGGLTAKTGEPTLREYKLIMDAARLSHGRLTADAFLATVVELVASRCQTSEDIVWNLAYSEWERVLHDTYHPLLSWARTKNVEMPPFPPMAKGVH